MFGFPSIETVQKERIAEHRGLATVALEMIDTLKWLGTGFMIVKMEQQVQQKGWTHEM